MMQPSCLALQKDYPQQHRGVVSLEFAIVASIFFLTVLMLINLGGVMYRAVAYSEAARAGVRLAASCDFNDRPEVLATMQAIAPGLQDGNLSLEYFDASGNKCNANTETGCQIAFITLALTGLTYAVNTPVGVINFNLPNYKTSIVRESMDSTKNSKC